MNNSNGLDEMDKDKTIPLGLASVDRIVGKNIDNGLKLSMKNKGDGLSRTKKVTFRNNNKGQNIDPKQKDIIEENREHIIANDMSKI